MLPGRLESFSTKAERRGRVRLVQFDSTEKFKGNRFGRFAQVFVEFSCTRTYWTSLLLNSLVFAQNLFPFKICLLDGSFSLFPTFLLPRFRCTDLSRCRQPFKKSGFAKDATQRVWFHPKHKKRNIRVSLKDSIIPRSVWLFSVDITRAACFFRILIYCYFCGETNSRTI